MLGRASVPPMPSTTFVARHPGPFSALVQRAEMGGLRLEPLAPVRVTDRYYDTDTGDLLRRGLALRVREQGGRQTAGLQAVDDDRALPDGLPRPGADRALPGDADRRADDDLDLPPGPLRDAVRRIAGDAPLLPLLSLRQYRTPRVVKDGAATVGVLSFDVVVHEVPGAHVVSNEVEVESHSGDLADRLAPAFEAQGLDRSERSTFARAVLRHTRAPSQPVLLLPDEVRELERAAASGDVKLRRRASAVLLDARGFRPDTIAAQTGMSMARVRYWLQQFREVRLEMLGRGAAVPRRRVVRPAAERAPELPVEGHTPMPMTPVPTPDRPELAPRSEPPVRPQMPHGGDGMPAPTGPAGVADMAELLDLFAPAHPDTPHLDDWSSQDRAEDDPAEDDPVELSLAGPTSGDSPGSSAPAPAPPVAESAPAGHRSAPATRPPKEDEEVAAPMRSAPRFPTPRLNPYPVVLGPVRAAREAPRGPSGNGSSLSNGSALSGEGHGGSPADAETDRTPAAGGAVGTTRERGPIPEPTLRPLTAAARAFTTPASTAPAGGGPRPSAPGVVRDPFAEVDLQQLGRTAPAPQASPPVEGAPPRLGGDTPLAEAARLSLGHYLAQFDAQSARFLSSRAPSDARRLLVAAHRLRVTAETFAPVLPAQAVRQLVSGLRPLAVGLAAGLGSAQRAARSSSREHARLAVAELAGAAAELDGPRHRDWRARAGRLLDHLDRQHGLGEADFAEPAPDDWVGRPGDTPAPTRLGHVLGSAVWSRFEAVRAFEGRLAPPAPDGAAHLAVALSALRFVLGLAQPVAADVAAALDAAERAVTRAPHEPAVVAGVWAEVVAAPFKGRLAEVAAAI